MKHKTATLEGALLDAVVALAEGIKVRWDAPNDLCVCYEGGDDTGRKERRGPHFNPSRDWSLGGPIIERERISVLAQVTTYSGIALNRVDRTWEAEAESAPGVRLTGPTPLVAAMRAYVASTLGDEVELPEGATPSACLPTAPAAPPASAPGARRP